MDCAWIEEVVAVLVSAFECLKAWFMILKYWFSILQNQNWKEDLQNMTWQLMFKLYCNSDSQCFGLHKSTMSTDKMSMKLVD